MTLPFEATPEFAKFSIYLAIATLSIICVSLPAITIILWTLVSDTSRERRQFQRAENQIADELEKLRFELKRQRETETSQSKHKHKEQAGHDQNPKHYANEE